MPGDPSTKRIVPKAMGGARLGTAPTRRSRRLGAALISSQLLGVAYCRFVVGIPALVKLDEGALAAALGRTLQRYLDGPLGD
jgi:hypothetical protein